MKTPRAQFKNVGLFCFLLGLAILVMPRTGQCFYHASTGRWLSRDPVGERGGKNLYCNLRNNPLCTVDFLGLQGSGYNYQESSVPYGFWFVSLADVPVEEDLTLKGFNSTYWPSLFTGIGWTRCECELKNIVLVQAIKARIWGISVQVPHFDVFTDRDHPYPHHDANTPIPPYANSGLTIVDAPHAIQNPNLSGTWTIEDCAVCRTRSGLSVNDRVLGCVKLIFHIDDDGVRTLSVRAGGTLQSGRVGYFVISEAPGEIWEEALKRWRIPGNGM